MWVPAWDPAGLSIVSSWVVARRWSFEIDALLGPCSHLLLLLLGDRRRWTTGHGTDLWRWVLWLGRQLCITLDHVDPLLAGQACSCEARRSCSWGVMAGVG